MDNSWNALIKDSSGPLTERPFSDLKALIEKKKSRKPAKKEATGGISQKNQRKSTKHQAECSDEALFLEAVQDVTPLHPKREGEEIDPEMSSRPAMPALPNPQEMEKAEILKALKALVSGKAPFPVKQTPEFVEGPDPRTNEWLVTRLHNGEFSVQGYCDLHGLDTLGAIDACEAFLNQAISEGRRCVAFIHGRGLSSPKGPILKEVVTRWIAHGRFRKFVLAYSSAPVWDGGAGVTYVLLQRRPQGKKRRARTSGGPFET
ncbi:MAG: Smr/MutS family protein [Dissulfurimicrobium sp.]|nr:Smr/MutS family protein [Dissulfurimicrobium hydrothermale]UKL13706.1 Smr/MutS family protein [Dissulfurimicrobium hydrothermale]